MSTRHNVQAYLSIGMSIGPSLTCVFIGLQFKTMLSYCISPLLFTNSPHCWHHQQHTGCSFAFHLQIHLTTSVAFNSQVHPPCC